MSIDVVYSRSLYGMNAPLVEIETLLSNGLPSFNIVGLPDTEVKESRERVRAAILQSGFTFPNKKIIVNLAPAELPKESGRFDLPIAISILLASKQINNDQISNFEFAGELALSGDLRPIRGAVLMLQESIKSNRYFILPKENAQFASFLETDKELGAISLLEVASFLNKKTNLEANYNSKLENIIDNNDNSLDMSDIKGQYTAKLTIEIVAAGGHSLLMIGPPGTGKTMLAYRLPSILPPLTKEEIFENISLYSVIDSNLYNIDKKFNYYARPFRAPHHSISASALVGGGSIPRPGEISLSNNGVLFLDELTEFNKNALEVLREPLEIGKINISRTTRQSTFPAKFQLIAAMNPCPCGYFNHPKKNCSCSQEQINRYKKKISGPFVDRIDLIIEVPALSNDDLTNTKPEENSISIKNRILKARKMQLERQNKINCKLTTKELESIANISTNAKKTLANLIEKLNISARSYHKILKVSRTIADLAEDKIVLDKHVLKAISLRRQIN